MKEISIIEKKKGVVRAEIWYAQKKSRQKGMIRYRESVKPLTKNSRKVRTLLSDLTLPEEELIGRFTKNCRYEIRRAPRENVSVFHYSGKEITEEMCESFVRYFEEFWKSKGVGGVETDKIRQEMLRYVKSESFALTEAKIGDTTVVYHTYIVGEDAVRLYQSASHYRMEEEIPQSVVGMANRFLHKEDMLWFKQSGKLVYDWGGAGEREEVASITRFKEAFGGAEAYFYDGEEVTGIWPQMYKALVSVAGKFDKRQR